MRILILTPTAFPDISGNAVTVERWQRALADKGIVAGVLTVPGLSPAEFAAHLKSFGPDLIHVHHAYKAGAILLDPVVSAACANLPVVVSPGGTDIYLDMGLPERKDVVAPVFNRARIVIAQSPEIARCLQQHSLAANSKIVNVPKASCWMGNEPYNLRGLAGCNGKHLLFFLPAGIRPVKGNLECLLALEKVFKIRPNIRFVAAGPTVDIEYSYRFKREIDRLSYFALWIHAIPPAAMRSAYEASDVVLNSSFSEGLANALLEAIAGGRPILASDIPGNRWTVMGENGDAPAGLLYDPYDPEDFVRNALKLIDDGGQRNAYGRAIQLRRSRWPTTEDEAAGLIEAYEKALVNV